MHGPLTLITAVHLQNRTQALRRALAARIEERARLAEMAAQAERDDRHDLLEEYQRDFEDVQLDIRWHRMELRGRS